MKKLNKKGFTIVELSIVIAVVAILSAVLIPTFSGIVNKAKDSAAFQNAKNAYTEYISGENFDYAEQETSSLNMIYEESSKRFVIVKAGVLDDENIYATEAAAKAALGCVEDDTATAEDETNYTSEEKGGFTVITFNN